FPDPWPKKRHRKRRLFNPRFIEEIVRTLAAGGTLDFATDYVEYYEEIQALLETTDRLDVLGSIPVRVQELGRDLTNFETKYTAEGRAIHRGAYVKP
ncbi:MAG: tRNA (guanosine(46)-N7)-methyltransferase TrmB, partial [Gemmatimonadetes bacterium]|nr:tRNA (guanosine(46)-N7)-methyltransferase TrmB [Gemmatimonadota bacterium]